MIETVILVVMAMWGGDPARNTIAIEMPTLAECRIQAKEWETRVPKTKAECIIDQRPTSVSSPSPASTTR